MTVYTLYTVYCSTVQYSSTVYVYSTVYTVGTLLIPWTTINITFFYQVKKSNI